MATLQFLVTFPFISSRHTHSQGQEIPYLTRHQIQCEIQSLPGHFHAHSFLTTPQAQLH